MNEEKFQHQLDYLLDTDQIKHVNQIEGMTLLAVSNLKEIHGQISRSKNNISVTGGIKPWTALISAWPLSRDRSKEQSKTRTIQERILDSSTCRPIGIDSDFNSKWFLASGSRARNYFEQLTSLSIKKEKSSYHQAKSPRSFNEMQSTDQPAEKSELEPLTGINELLNAKDFDHPKLMVTIQFPVTRKHHL